MPLRTVAKPLKPRAFGPSCLAETLSKANPKAEAQNAQSKGLHRRPNKLEHERFFSVSLFMLDRRLFQRCLVLPPSIEGPCLLPNPKIPNHESQDAM